ncbi:MAG: AAA family ATPase [Kofleriaceae bacterium]|nr:AAA family ATPase [Kofleriaceae bacterium]
MTVIAPLSPLGTARVDVAQDRAASDPHVRIPFPEDLAALARSTHLGEEYVHLVWELVQMAGAADRSTQRAQLLIGLLLYQAISDGSTQIELSDRKGLLARAATLGLGKTDLALVNRGADELLGTRHSESESAGQLALPFGENASGWMRLLDRGAAGAGPFVLDGLGEDWTLSTQRLHSLESRLARRLLHRSSVGPIGTPEHIDEALRELHVGTVSGFSLTIEQERAIRMALTRAVTVISGGPGTGKTSVIAAIVKTARRVDPSVTFALAAPTGKAADRMTQSLRTLTDAPSDSSGDAPARERLAASTLHRLLGWSPREYRYRHGDTSPLAERIVIVDEASMIDLGLMERLVAALDAQSRLVILGDADQLPSVDAGNVLADLVSAGDGPTMGVTRLTHSHRMSADDPAGAHILGIAHAVRDGKALRFAHTPAVAGAVHSSRELGPGVSLYEPSQPAERERFLELWWQAGWTGTEEDRARCEHSFDLEADAALLHRVFARHNERRLLCVTRTRATGAEAVNQWMGARFAREQRKAATNALAVGEPAMVVRNTYDEEVWNGDQGLLLWVQEGGVSRPMFVLQRGSGFAAHRLQALRPILERSYATTVHKAQGSEYDSVALWLPSDDIPRLWTREILYTALTRARHSVHLVGPADLLGVAIARRSGRQTGLTRQLARAAREQNTA